MPPATKEGAVEGLLTVLEEFVHHGMHHRILKLSFKSVELCTAYLSMFGALFLIVSTVLGIFSVIFSFVNKRVSGLKIKSAFCTGKVATLSRTRIEMGNMFAVGLELLVAMDVLETLTAETHHFSFETLGKLGAVAAFRTALAFFLAREVNELKHEMHESAHVAGKKDE
jgi:uncharacterized membrane protein